MIQNLYLMQTHIKRQWSKNECCNYTVEEQCRYLYMYFSYIHVHTFLVLVLTSDGQIVSLQGANMAAMLNQVKQTSPSPTADDNKTFVPPSNTNNNNHHTDSESNHENEDLT